jgi:hypothetical protein
MTVAALDGRVSRPQQHSTAHPAVREKAGVAPRGGSLCVSRQRAICFTRKIWLFHSVRV